MIALPQPSLDPRAPRIAVLAAMDQELRPLARRLAVERVEQLGSCRVILGRLGRTPLLVVRTGEGRRLAAAGATATFERHRPARALVLGVAGALSPALPREAIVAARCVRDGERDGASTDTAWLERALRVPGVRAGVAVSTARILHSAAEKTRAGRELSGEEPATVDLESAALVEVAARFGIPCLVLRAVCDAADEDLPLDFERCRDASGAIRRLAVLRQALAHPGRVPELWRLGRRVARCAERLADVAQHLLEHEEETR